MVSLWGRRNGNAERAEDQEHEDDDQTERIRRPVEPDERSRLLPRDPTWLSPDDPAVSPYNLWSIRALHGLTSVFLGLSFIWWTFILVSLFVDPPAMHTRGSGFFSFSFTTLTVGYLIIALMFFTIPSKPMTLWGVVLSIFLLVDMCVIFGVPSLRVEEGWVGIASVVWATFISFYNIIQNWSVAWGKREEEERLTGRGDQRRPLKEWIAVLAESIIIVVLAIVSILFTASLVLRARDATLPAPGSLYSVTGQNYRVHLACFGKNTDQKSGGHSLPTILVEGGEGPVEETLEPFIHNAYKKGTIGRYCYWDRPGLGWSDNAPSPHSAGMAADSLGEALALAGEEGPWILVSAGVGSIYSRIFATRHITEVQGMFLIDGTHEAYLSNIGKPGRGFLLWLRGVFSPLGLDRIAGAIFKGRSREDRVYGRSAYQTGRYIKAKLQENLVAETITKSEIQTARHVQMQDTPLMVVSSGIEVGKSRDWAARQEELTKITDSLMEWDVVDGAPHEVWRSFEGRQILELRLRQLVRA
ncbi:hypothetical protein ASPWEDRAFT_25587 [Aspergillus wentii DTO 134E9]|uniref:Mitochondrial integral membrane protein n=1 Tax=Aspergillus wentii DTO 134E9 TaxID=1073089 RepID=A0A1L9RXW5_ASPWE|nr:uncharacterized protein ASPWEDRAFT_25587 [Aspergillus wentii DTO 134E9]KAI9931541.1 hypothetical protein MW887_010118 [Aspergillus wentii]OJJ39790.1 hypothetical protein ASPWEDRAFT_25587 [Aspergillus wentii DTO 134E9]